MININCDMGEGVSVEADIMPYISACNIACGGHTGDRNSMLKTANSAIKNKVLIGAHPSYPDTVNFGRKHMSLNPEHLFDSLSEQIVALQLVLSELGQPLVHIKPHGALYNDAATDSETAQIVVDVVKSIDPNLSLFGLANSPMADIAEQAGLVFKHEAFIDRHYRDDGNLLERSHAAAMIDDVELIVERVKHMQMGKVSSWQGSILEISADTYCLHSDHPQALMIAQSLYRHFIEN